MPEVTTRAETIKERLRRRFRERKLTLTEAATALDTLDSLEREVIEASKAWAQSQSEEFSSGIPELQAEGQLRLALERLIEFEAKQE